ncbi:hypothetical protein PO883_06215 [Massilia sp. DJPM01]|uniref:hypothetical protein n=1 Tax=Massilia sp. DJPM01 TaxID=3024404 RepID=UPI00259E356F|nr:hypothetical protein [Massilia sp. DJPM01]MDM5176790.1 hypothetical protein [Massilia sp. DJPM01]
MNAQLISVEDDETGTALMLIGGVEIAAMSCLWYGSACVACPTLGELFNPTFSCLFDESDHADWASVFAGNPAQEMRLHRTGLWSYRALGRIVAIEGPEHAALADCGGCLIPLPVTLYDPCCIGVYVGFNIQRLSVSIA